MEHIDNIQDLGQKTILITGGCGFIGTNLTKYLADSGYQLRILDNLSVGNEANLRELQSQDSRLLNIKLIIGDIRDRDVVSQAVKGTDAVVHLAARSGVKDSLENPVETYDINVIGTLNLLEACRQNGAAKFIFASSNAVVGEQSPPIDELKIPQPLSPYGAAKLAGEALCSAYYHSFGLKAISLRFANCYGPYSDHKTSVIATFMKWAKEQNPLIIYGNGNQTRDFIHVNDVCRAIHLSLTASDSLFQTGDSRLFQIGSGLETSINELAEMLKGVTGGNLPTIRKPERQGEIRRIYLDITKAAAILGFKPEVRLRKGLNDLWRWLCSQTTEEITA